MPDALITDSGQRILDVGVIGAVCILLIAVLIIRERMYRSDLKSWEKQLDDAKKEHLNDVKRYAEIGETIREYIKGQTMSLQTEVKAAMEVIKDRLPR